MEYISNEDVVKKIGGKRKLLLRIKKRQLIFLGHINEERRSGEFDTPKTYSNLEGQKCSGILPIIT